MSKPSLNHLKLAALILAGFLSSQDNQSSNNSADSIARQWKRVDASGVFSFSLPHDMEGESKGRTDSYVGQYHNKQMRVSFDCGEYTGIPDAYFSKPEFRQTLTKISGREARIVSFLNTDGFSKYKYFAAVHFPRVRNVSLSRIRLTLEVAFDEERDKTTAQEIFESIKFSD